LKWKSEVVLKDEVLTKFIDRCEEIETHIGKETLQKLHDKSKPKEKEKEMTLTEMMREYMKEHPHRHFTIKNFDEIVDRVKRQHYGKFAS
jgi:hypothetical protein